MMVFSRNKGGAPKVKSSKEVRRVRARFAQALNLGHPKHVAAKLASGEEVIAPASPAPESIQQEEIRQPAIRTDTASIAGSPVSSKPEAVTIPAVNPKKTAQDDIPPNWQDLPWPNLKTLAAHVSGGKTPSSRKDAEAMIYKAIE